MDGDERGGRRTTVKACSSRRLAKTAGVARVEDEDTNGQSGVEGRRGGRKEEGGREREKERGGVTGARPYTSFGNTLGFRC